MIFHIFLMVISVGAFMVTLKWFQDFHLVFEPMAVYVNTIFSNIPISEECLSVCLIRFVFVFNPHTLLNGIICMFLT